MVNATLKTLDLSFFARGELGKWMQSAKAAGFDVPDHPSPSVAYVTTFGDGTLDGYYCVGEVHKCPKKDAGDVHWQLTIKAMPKKEPPADMVARSERLGGVSGLMSVIRDMWQGEPPDAVRVHATMTLDVAGLGLVPPGGIPTRPFKTAVQCDGSVITLNGGVQSCFWKLDPPLFSASSLGLMLQDGEPADAIVLGESERVIGPELLDDIRREFSQCLTLLTNG